METPRSSISEPSSSPRIDDTVHSAAGFAIERPKSACDEQFKEHHDAWYPRRLSYSIAQNAIETWYLSASALLTQAISFRH
jgi:hypothetical protein